MGRSFLYKGIGKTFVCKYFACNRTVCSRIVSGLITGSLLMGLYGCGATENTTVSDTQKQESSQEDLEPVTFTFYNADGMEDTWTDPVAQKITEKTGVTLKMDYPADASDNRIALMVATGEYPDLVFAKGDAPTLIQNDALIDMVKKDIVTAEEAYVKAVDKVEILERFKAEMIKFSPESLRGNAEAGKPAGTTTTEDNSIKPKRWQV
jgi:hypothetical protein